MAAGGCLDEHTVVAFLEGTLEPRERSIVVDHLDSCGPCTELTTCAAAELTHQSRQPGDEGRPFIGALAPGSRVDRYQILGAVGRGGMGEVYAAYHPDLDRRIALKVVQESGAITTERRTRLLREARAIARLSHPNVVAVYDAGTVDDRVYIAMEFVEGDTVDAWLRSKPRSWREIVDVFMVAGRGLAAAHAAGIVHRDFKPQNVMIGRDGSVRVMDFGLARLAEETVEAPSEETKADRPHVPTTVTKTGALVGTLGYMAPEQFRGEALDARADQFSFCVALHEALHGVRPALAHIATAQGAEGGESLRTANAPAWLRGLVSRGLADRPEERFASMHELIRVLARGRARPRRRALGATAGLAVLVVALGGWRAARGGRIQCSVPAARLEAAWSGRDDARRQSIHRAFAASGRPTAEASWQRVSKVLDDYVGQWSAMYVETCEATHVRGEQSADVLDLRMSCLNDNIDQVRALTDVLANADAAVIGHTIAAARELTPIRRCADVPLLRSAVPLPRDEKTLREVQTLQQSLRNIQALRDMGQRRSALDAGLALRPEVEATQYGPLLAELLELIGMLQSDLDGDPTAGEVSLRKAFLVAEASHDDATAAKAAASLAGVLVAYSGRIKDAELWAQLAQAILDRLGTGHERIQAWVLNNQGGALYLQGNFREAMTLFAHALALKEQSLGSDHPDVALGLDNLSAVLTELGRPEEALKVSAKSMEILARHGDPDLSSAVPGINRGDALRALGRHAEAEKAYNQVLSTGQTAYSPLNPILAYAFQGLGEVKLAQHHTNAAVPLLEQAFRIRKANERNALPLGDTKFALARALRESGRDRRRALSLAREAQQHFATLATHERERAVVAWLTETRRPSERHPSGKPQRIGVRNTGRGPEGER